MCSDPKQPKLPVPFPLKYNVYLPLDTLALNGALNEWGHHAEAEDYLGYFLATKINRTTGEIIYSLFNCDSDADYGRIVREFSRTAAFGGNRAWAREHLPTVHAMARLILDRVVIRETL